MLNQSPSPAALIFWRCACEQVASLARLCVCTWQLPEFMAAAQKGLDLKLMNENMTSEGLKKSKQAETRRAYVSETAGNMNPQPD